MPSMNSELVTIAPAIEAFTRSNIPARNAVMAMTSSVNGEMVAVPDPFPADGVTCFCRHAFRRVTEQGGEGHDC